MKPTTPTQILNVQEIRALWLPHKERLNRSRDGHPTSIRFHRACSWLDEAEHFDASSHVDHRLIFQWTAFNALYGQWDVLRHESLADRESWQEFLKRMLDLDAAGHLIALLQEHRGLALTILGNAYLNRYFWQAPNGEQAGKTGRGGRRKAESWYAQKDWGIILGNTVDRIYLLRCQLVHGAATLRSQLNRTALKHSSTMLGLLLPTFLRIWVEHGADEDWGVMCYPPVDEHSAAQRPGTSRPKPR